MARLGSALAAVLVAVSVPAFGSGDGGCSDSLPASATNGEHPLSITIESALQVGRLGLTGRYDGNAVIDPQTGAKLVGPNMIDLGGLTFQGKAGGEAELSDFRTDLPQVAMLDANGQLQFNFGATITSKNAQGGDFRGRIPIRVEYY